MWIKNPDGTWYDDSEYGHNNSSSSKDGMIAFRIDLDNYYKLSNLAYKSGIKTLDIGALINLVIKNYPDDLKLK